MKCAKSVQKQFCANFAICAKAAQYYFLFKYMLSLSIKRKVLRYTARKTTLLPASELKLWVIEVVDTYILSPRLERTITIPSPAYCTPQQRRGGMRHHTIKSND